MSHTRIFLNVQLCFNLHFKLRNGVYVSDLEREEHSGYGQRLYHLILPGQLESDWWPLFHGRSESAAKLTYLDTSLGSHNYMGVTILFEHVFNYYSDYSTVEANTNRWGWVAGYGSL